MPSQDTGGETTDTTLGAQDGFETGSLQAGLRIKNAIIVGGLDLSDCSADDVASELTVDLENCVIEPLSTFAKPLEEDVYDVARPSLLARHAHFSRLRLHRCRFSFLDITGSDIESDLEVTEAGGFEKSNDFAIEEDMYIAADGAEYSFDDIDGCRVDAVMVEVGGRVRMDRSSFHLPEKYHKYRKGIYNFALNFAEARIGGSVFLQQKLDARGGINFVNAKVRGDIWADGAHLTAGGSKYSLRMQAAHVEGFLLLRSESTGSDSSSAQKTGVSYRRFESDGTLDFLFAEIRGLYIQARFVKPTIGSSSIILNGSKIDSILNIYADSEVAALEGQIDLTGVAISGNCQFSNLKVKGSISMNRAQVDGDLLFHNCKVEQSLALKNSTIRGGITIPSDCSFHGTEKTEARHIVSIEPVLHKYAIRAENLSVGGDFLLLPSCDGDLELAGAEIGGDLEIGSVRNQSGLVLSAQSVLDLTNARISRALRVSEQIKARPLTFSSAEPVQSSDTPQSRFPVPSRMRISGLDFCNDLKLLEVETVSGDNQAIVLAFLFDSKSLTFLDGNADTLLSAFEADRLDLSSLDKAESYLRFYLRHFFLYGKAPLIIVDDASKFKREGDTNSRPELSRPLTLKAVDAGHTYEAISIIFFDGILFELKFELSKHGTVSVLGEKKLLDDAGAYGDEILKTGIRLKPNSAGEWPNIPEAVADTKWEDVSSEDKSHIEKLWHLAPKALKTEADKLRSLSPSFYPGWMLYEFFRSGTQSIETYLVHLGESRNAEPMLVRLDGTSPPIHYINREQQLRMDAVSRAKDYLRFFCANVWGEEGAFRIVEDLSDIPPHWQDKVDAIEDKIQKIVLKKRDKDGYEMTAFVLYSNALFKSDFKVFKTGVIEMLNDTPLVADMPWPSGVLYQNKVRRAGKGAPEIGDGWPLPPAIPGSWIDQPETKLTSMFESHQDAVIDLSWVSVGTLDDHMGDGWPSSNVRLELGGLSCKQFSESRGGQFTPARYQSPEVRESQIQSSPAEQMRDALRNQGGEAFGSRTLEPEQKRLQKSRWKSRLNWLLLQYGAERKPNIDNWNPQPFVMVVNYLNMIGDHYGANKLNSQRLTFERQIECQAPEQHRRVGAWLARPLRWTYGLLFDHGQSPVNAILTFMAFVLIGFLAASFMVYGTEVSLLPFLPSLNELGVPAMNPVLELDVSPVQPLVRAGEEVPSAYMNIDLACREHVQPWIYALDVFLPLIDLYQERQCEVGSDYPAWRWAKALYGIAGWVITSLTVLTVTGVLRRYPEK